MEICASQSLCPSRPPDRSSQKHLPNRTNTVAHVTVQSVTYQIILHNNTKHLLQVNYPTKQRHIHQCQASNSLLMCFFFIQQNPLTACAAN